MAKIRVHELAKELGIPSKEMVNTLQKLGLDVKNHMSTMEDSQANWVRKDWPDQVHSQTVPRPLLRPDQKPIKLYVRLKHHQHTGRKALSPQKTLKCRHPMLNPGLKPVTVPPVSPWPDKKRNRVRRRIRTLIFRGTEDPISLAMFRPNSNVLPSDLRTTDSSQAKPAVIQWEARAVLKLPPTPRYRIIGPALRCQAR
jgi:hypothetical protein